MSIVGIASAAGTLLGGSNILPKTGGAGGGVAEKVTGLLGGLIGGKSAAATKGTPAWRQKYAAAHGMTVDQLIAAGGIPAAVRPGGRGFGGALRGGGAGAVGGSLPNTGGGRLIAETKPPLRSVGPAPVISAGTLPAPMASGIFERGLAAMGGAPAVGQAALAVTRAGIRGLIARRSGGETFGARGDDFLTTGGYPAGPGLEDLAEQTYTPDLWAARLARGIAKPNAPLKLGYSVPLVDTEGDIEGRIRATHCAIPKSAVILYGGGDSSTEMGHYIGQLMRGYKYKGLCEVVDEEGGGPGALAGAVYVPKYKKRRGGIHVSAADLRAAQKVGRSMDKIIKTHSKLKVIKPSRRR